MVNFFAVRPVCTTTIWMGHLAKTVKQAQIMGAFEDFGLVKSVDVSSLNTIDVRCIKTYFSSSQ